ncbi:MAG TPA: flagellar hook-basal body protein [Oculatellaceae cyanobacterium]|jgi:flagellar basal-body rod protein FlgF
MLRGLYTAASGMLSAQMATDTLASNLANVNTIGFKGNKLNYQSFPEMLMNRLSSQGVAPVGSIMTGSQIYGTFTNFSQGQTVATGNTFDMAIEGGGFFTVKNRYGQLYYTRAGNFTIDENGFLTTLNGDRVQGELGDIQLNLDEGPFNINQRGELIARTRMVDRFKIARFVDDHALEKVGDNLYAAGRNAQLLPAPAADASLGYKIHQGMLEQSNVNPVAEMVNNIQGLRLYEALQKNIHLANETLQKAVNDVGRYRG